jgi:glycopeptide antibiotics resistance protein
MGNKGSPIVSFLPFRQISPASHLPFIPFADIPSVQFTLPLPPLFPLFVAIPFGQCMPYLSYRFSPLFTAIPLSQLGVTSCRSRFASNS